MAKEKVTLTLDGEQLRELRSLVGARSLSSAVDAAIAAYAQRMRHLAGVDEWLLELERAHGPAPIETIEWAARILETWDKARKPGRTRRAS